MTTTTKIDWVDLIYRGVLLAAVLAGVGYAYDGNSHMSRLEQQIVGHLTTHPDLDLSRRIDRLQHEVDRATDRIRQLEIERRARLEE